MFDFALQVHGEALAPAQPCQPGEEYDLTTAEAQIMAACDLIADAKVANFRLICGGEQPWPVDVRTDLSVFLDQIPGLLRSLREKEPSFRLSMYEQGIETILIFSRLGDALQVRCEPLVAGTALRFGAKDERVEVKTFVNLVLEVVKSFVESCERVCPALLDRSEINEWRRTIERQMAELLGHG